MRNEEDWDQLNKSKPYHELLAEQEKKLEKKRKARMDAAKAAMQERKRRGIDISMAKTIINPNVQRQKLSEEYT